jgi:hypothetical protein
MKTAHKKIKVARTVAARERDAYANELLKCQRALADQRAGYLTQLATERHALQLAKDEVQSWREKHAAMMKRPDVRELVARIDAIAAPDNGGDVDDIHEELGVIVGGLLLRGDEYRMALAPFARRCLRYDEHRGPCGRYPDATPLELEGNADPTSLRVRDLRMAKKLYETPALSYVPERDLA